MAEDQRYVYGACCTWHGPIQQAKRNSAGLPGCPQCGGVLMEYQSRAEWDAQVERFAAKNNEPLYPAWIATLPTRCVPLKGWDWRASLEDFKRTRIN